MSKEKIITPPIKCKFWKKSESALDFFPSIDSEYDETPLEVLNKYFEIIEEYWNENLHNIETGFDTVFVLKCKECGCYFYFNYNASQVSHVHGYEEMTLIPAIEKDIEYAKYFKFSDLNNVYPRLEYDTKEDSPEKPVWKGKDLVKNNKQGFTKTIIDNKLETKIKKRKKELDKVEKEEMTASGRSIPMEEMARIMTGDFKDKEIDEYKKRYNLTTYDLNTIGMGYRAKKKMDLAEKFFKESIEKDPTNGDPYGNLISQYCLKKDYGKAVGVFLDGEKKVVNSLDFIYFHGSRALYLAGDYQTAITVAYTGIKKTRERPLENLYIVFLESCVKAIQSGSEKSIAEKDLQSIMNGGAMISLEAIKLFPKSEDIKELHDMFIEKKK